MAREPSVSGVIWVLEPKTFADDTVQVVSIRRLHHLVCMIPGPIIVVRVDGVVHGSEWVDF